MSIYKCNECGSIPCMCGSNLHPAESMRETRDKASQDAMVDERAGRLSSERTRELLGAEEPVKMKQPADPISLMTGQVPFSDFHEFTLDRIQGEQLYQGIDGRGVLVYVSPDWFNRMMKIGDRVRVEKHGSEHKYFINDRQVFEPTMQGSVYQHACQADFHHFGKQTHGLDTNNEVFFYEQEFYVLSNFSAFMVQYKGIDFPTAEHAYHYQRFSMEGVGHSIRWKILEARSAHDAFKIAQLYKQQHQKLGWDGEKVQVMREIIACKAAQHEYVRRKLMETGERRLIENSWRDDFWGWGPNKDGKNMLGKLWMEVRAGLLGRWPA